MTILSSLFSGFSDNVGGSSVGLVKGLAGAFSGFQAASIYSGLGSQQAGLLMGAAKNIDQLIKTNNDIININLQRQLTDLTVGLRMSMGAASVGAATSGIRSSSGSFQHAMLQSLDNADQAANRLRVNQQIASKSMEFQARSQQIQLQNQAAIAKYNSDVQSASALGSGITGLIQAGIGYYNNNSGN